MADSAHADAERTTEPDTTPASDSAGADAGAGATGATPGGGIGDMALQAKTTVGRTDDPMEREADDVAQRVMRATEPPKPGGGPGPTGAAPAPGSAPAPDQLQRQTAPPPPTPTAEPGGDVVRRQTATAAPDSVAGGPLPPSVQDYLDTSASGGSPLPEATRRDFEARLSADLGNVRVHDDPGAAEAARVIGAVAFTRNNHIYFASGMYDPAAPTGRSILAHELTHVLQQSGRRPPPPGAGTGNGEGARPPVTRDSPGLVRRTPTPAQAAAGEKKKTHEGKVGTIDTDAKTMVIKELPMPAFKARLAKQEMTVRKAGEKRNTGQIKVWEDKVGPTVQAKVGDKIGKLTEKKKRGENRTPPFYLQYGKSKRYLIGSVDEIAAAVRRPRWDKDGDFHLFDVDHKIEWQLGGDDTTPDGNLWLLERSANRSAGSTIRASIEKTIGEVLTESRPHLAGRKPNADTVRKSYAVTVKKGKAAGGPAGPPAWDEKDMAKKALTDPLELVPDKKVVELRGSPTSVAIFTKPYGGDVKNVDPSDASSWKKNKSFQMKSISAPKEGGGKVRGTMFPGHERFEPGDFEATIQKMTGVEYGGYLDPTSYAKRMLVFKGLSPVELEDAEFNPDVGLVGRAKIATPTIPLLGDVEVGLKLDGPNVEAYALVTAGALKLPGPFQVTGGALEVTAGLDGFGVEGSVNFEIERFASGRLFGLKKGGKSSKFAVGGEMKFDTEMFTKAELSVKYEDDKWSGKGEVAVGEGKIAGIKSGSVMVELDGDKLAAKGSFESSVKGLEKGTLDVKYVPDVGMEIAGTLGLGKLPGIKGGTVDGKVTTRKDGQGYSLSGGVTAEPDIPGVTGSVTGRFEDGAFLVDANLGYQKGMLSGKVRLGITNQAVDPATKQPAGPPTPNTTVYGGGQVTIKITPWLQGTVGIELRPNGDVVVTGEVALPNELELFKERKVEKNIFTIGMDIPIVGVAVLGQRIGIFATISGGLDAHAGFGPGVLRALALKVTYNPSNEAETRITGKAELYVPAAAGLKLFVSGALGAGIPVVSAKAGLKVSGGLALEGAAKAGVDVDWSTARGLVIDAKGELFVEPKFRFGIEGFVDVSADVWVDTIELYRKTWSLASFEYGSNLRFGVTFPVHYEDGKPFELSTDQVQFTYPTIDTNELLRGLIKQVA